MGKGPWRKGRGIPEGGLPTRQGITRREFLATGIGVGAGLVLLGGCGGGSESSGPLTFMTWANSAEEKGFRGIIDRYQKKNPGQKVEMEIVPKERCPRSSTRASPRTKARTSRGSSTSDRSLLLGDALVDLSDISARVTATPLPRRSGSRYYKDKPYGVPQHTDTLALFYNPNIRRDRHRCSAKPGRELDVGPIYGGFAQVKKAGVRQYPFAMSWQDDLAPTAG